MNCLEYRRRLTIEPRSQDVELANHARACASCAAFSKRMFGLEDRLEQALAIDAPSGLASRIMLRQTTTQTHHRSQRRILAYAAGITLVIGMALGWLLTPTYEALDQVVLAHINNEIDHLSENHNVSMGRLETVMAAVGGTVLQPVGQIRYAGNCPIRKHKGVHVILDGDQGPVTVLVMPGESVTQRQRVGDQRFRGLIVPVDNGSIAIVGEKAEDIDALENRVVTNFKIAT